MNSGVANNSIGSTNSFSDNFKFTPASSSSVTTSSSSSSSFSLGNMFSQTSWTTWILIVLLLSFLGINIFVYLAKGTQSVSDFIAPYIASFSGLFVRNVGDTTKQIVNTSATGSKAGIDITAGTITTGIDAVGSVIEGTSTSGTQMGQPVSSTMMPKDNLQQNSLNNALNDATKQQQNSAASSHATESNTYIADDSYSSIQTNKSSSKSGWCYIGEEQGVRSCAQVGPNDQCMSGNIFPTSEVCVNPSLRA